MRRTSVDEHERREARIDRGLSALLAIQCLTLFVAIPIGSGQALGRVLLDLCHLAFAAVCVAILTRHRAIQLALIGAVALLAAGPLVNRDLTTRLGLRHDVLAEGIALIAFAFNAIVTTLVARHVFGAGRVTAHRIQGAVLLYLDVAALFAIAYGTLDLHWPGAIAPASGVASAAGPGVRSAELAYFSLATITTTGYGDLIPIHPLARSLATLEAVFGQLFPATLLARLVALHLAQRPTPAGAGAIDSSRDDGTDAGRSRADAMQPMHESGRSITETHRPSERTKGTQP